MKKNVILGMLLATAILTGCGGKTNTETQQTTNQAQTVTEAEAPAQAQPETPAQTGENPQIKIYVKDYGVITAELDSQAAPITVENFLKLTKEGFYDGLTFHRIMDGFMIQGGDPLGTGMGGSDEEIKGEFSSNGVDNPISHTRGTLSMARSRIKDSASSQFFIVHKDSTFLDGDYAGFGHVTDGMDVVDKICETIKAEDSNGTVSKENQPVIEKIEVVE